MPRKGDTHLLGRWNVSTKMSLGHLRINLFKWNSSSTVKPLFLSQLGPVSIFPASRWDVYPNTPLSSPPPLHTLTTDSVSSSICLISPWYQSQATGSDSLHPLCVAAKPGPQLPVALAPQGYQRVA